MLYQFLNQKVTIKHHTTQQNLSLLCKVHEHRPEMTLYAYENQSTGNQTGIKRMILV